MMKKKFSKKSPLSAFFIRENYELKSPFEPSTINHIFTTEQLRSFREAAKNGFIYKPQTLPPQTESQNRTHQENISTLLTCLAQYQISSENIIYWLSQGSFQIPGDDKDYKYLTTTEENILRLVNDYQALKQNLTKASTLSPDPMVFIKEMLLESQQKLSSFRALMQTQEEQLALEAEALENKLKEFSKSLANTPFDRKNFSDLEKEYNSMIAESKEFAKHHNQAVKDSENIYPDIIADQEDILKTEPFALKSATENQNILDEKVKIERDLGDFIHRLNKTSQRVSETAERIGNALKSWQEGCHAALDIKARQAYDELIAEEEKRKAAAERKASKKAQKKAKDEAKRQTAEAEAKAKHQAAETEARRQAEEEVHRVAKAAAERKDEIKKAKRKAKADAQRKAREAAEEARRSAEAEARRQAAEIKKVKRKAEAETRQAALEAEAKRKAETVARRQAAEDVQRKAEAKKKEAAEEARLKAKAPRKAVTAKSPSPPKSYSEMAARRLSYQPPRAEPAKNLENQEASIAAPETPKKEEVSADNIDKIEEKLLELKKKITAETKKPESDRNNDLIKNLKAAEASLLFKKNLLKSESTRDTLQSAPPSTPTRNPTPSGHTRHHHDKHDNTSAPQAASLPQNFYPQATAAFQPPQQYSYMPHAAPINPMMMTSTQLKQLAAQAEMAELESLKQWASYQQANVLFRQQQPTSMTYNAATAYPPYYLPAYSQPPGGVPVPFSDPHQHVFQQMSQGPNPNISWPGGVILPQGGYYPPAP